MGFKLCHNLLQDMKSMCIFKTLPLCAQVSDSFAVILQYTQTLKINLHCTMVFW